MRAADGVCAESPRSYSLCSRRFSEAERRSTSYRSPPAVRRSAPSPPRPDRLRLSSSPPRVASLRLPACGRVSLVHRLPRTGFSLALPDAAASLAVSFSDRAGTSRCTRLHGKTATILPQVAGPASGKTVSTARSMVNRCWHIRAASDLRTVEPPEMPLSEAASRSAKII